MTELPNYVLFGKIGEDFDYETVKQFKKAMSIPPALQGALMPDGHLGYSIPIGGVVLLENAVSPAFVGVDISCMMMLSIFNISAEDFLYDRDLFADFLDESTCFGLGGVTEKNYSPMFEKAVWSEIDVLKEYKDKAIEQLGSSGGGNHFADLMVLKPKPDNTLGLDSEEQYMALLTHSGSRGTGFNVAKYYINLSDELRDPNIPKGYGWFSLDSEIGQEYMVVLEEMRMYAKTNHDIIHGNFLKRVGGMDRLLGRIYNVHNLAWKMPGTKNVIHRKGATPAHSNDLGVIPGTSSTKSFVVRGKGYTPSLWSASHGAGRTMSRSKAKKLFDREAYDSMIEEKDILHIGVAADETELAYKDIEQVIALQDRMVEVEAEMVPKVVIMGAKK